MSAVPLLTIVLDLPFEFWTFLISYTIKDDIILMKLRSFFYFNTFVFFIFKTAVLHSGLRLLDPTVCKTGCSIIKLYICLCVDVFV